MNPLIYIHIWKNAGTSMESKVKSVLGNKSEVFTPWNINEKDLSNKSIILGHTRFGIHEPLGIKPRYITTLRDPVSRYISGYSFLHQDRTKTPLKQVVENKSVKQVFDEIQYRDISVFEHFNNQQTRILSGIPMYTYSSNGLCQTDNFIEIDRNIFEKAKYNIDRYFVDIDIVNNFTKQCNRVLALSGHDKEVENYHINKTDKLVEIDAKEKDIILHNNMWDLELFKYIRDKS